MELTHEVLLAAVTRVRESHLPVGEQAVRAHCDDLEATLHRHLPDLGACAVCTDRDGFGMSRRVEWPCPDVLQVIDRLTTWGAL